MTSDATTTATVAACVTSPPTAGDTAVTLPVGSVSRAASDLMQVCSDALLLAIEQVRPGSPLSRIGETVQRHVEAAGFSVVRDLVGHGIGTAMHQKPEVPNFVSRSVANITLEPGLVIAIEPMINAGGYKVKTDRQNKWTVRTADGQLSAHLSTPSPSHRAETKY